MQSSRRTGAAILAIFALSGCAELVLETTWLRWFRLLLGATAPAVSATLVAFFLGQAAGAAAASRLASRLRRPLVAYGLLEGAAALVALAVPALLQIGESLSAQAYRQLQGAPGALALARFAIALTATLPTSLLLGATLPTLGAAWLGSRAELGTRGTRLYAASLLGAAAGAALAAFALPPRLGVSGTYRVGVAALLLVAAAALALARGLPQRVPATAAPRRAPPPETTLGARGRAVLAALSGFGSFAFQVLLVRALAQVLDQSVYAFGAVLCVLLVCLALASAGVSLLLARTRVRVESALALALGTAGIGIAALPVALRDLTAGFDPGVVAGAGGVVLPALRLTALSAGVPLLAAGAVLPLVFAAAGRAAGAGPAGPLGGLLAANTLGALLGALAAPYGILAWLPLWPGFLALSLAYAVPCALVPLRGRRARLRRDLGLAFAWILVLTRVSPLHVAPVRLAPGEEIRWLESGASGVVAVIARGSDRSIRTDGHYDLGGSADRVHQERQGLLAGLLRPGARRALWIGSATGISAGALLAQPLSSLTLVEILPAVAEAGARFFAPDNRGVHADPRVHTVLDDARSYVRASDARFDLVVADLFVPWRAGTGALYTREHFAAVRAHLAPDGAFVQWLPLYQLSEAGFLSIAATFADAFPRAALFRGDFYGRFPIAALVGYAGDPPDPAAVARAARRLARAGESDRWMRDPVGLWSLYVGPLAALAPAFESAPRNSDDRPLVEFAAPRARARRAAGRAPLLTGDEWVRLSARAGAALGARDPVFPGLPAPALRAARAGARLQAAGAAWSEGRAGLASEQMAAAAADLPPALLDPDRPDPSAAELWPQRPR